jgi:hypothetical protein
MPDVHPLRLRFFGGPPGHRCAQGPRLRSQVQGVCQGERETGRCGGGRRQAGAMSFCCGVAAVMCCVPAGMLLFIHDTPYPQHTRTQTHLRMHTQTHTRMLVFHMIPSWSRSCASAACRCPLATRWPSSAQYGPSGTAGEGAKRDPGMRATGPATAPATVNETLFSLHRMKC